MECVMDNERVLEKIEELMLVHGYSKYRLSKLSGISKSTLATIFNKRSTVSLNNLSLLCDAFDLTLSEFFALFEGKETEKKVILDFPVEWWNGLDPEVRRKMSTLMFTMAKLMEKDSPGKND